MEYVSSEQEVLFNTYEIKKTSDFWKLLDKGEIDLMSAAITYIENNLEGFSNYSSDWIRDRRSEVSCAFEYENKGMKRPEPSRTKDEARIDLYNKFGFNDTAGFRHELAQGNTGICVKFLKYIEKSPSKFPQYLRTWFDWRRDRWAEINAVKKKN